MSLARYRDWRSIVQHHTQLLKREVDEVWLGGFSTGANLVTSEALENSEVAGLLLISPALIPGNLLTKLLPIANLFSDWLDKDSIDNNYTRYSAVSTNGATQYYYSSREVRSQLKQATFNKPVIMAVSADDNVINSHAIKQLFQHRFSHPRSKLLWFTNQLNTFNKDHRIQQFNSKLPQQRISNFSHMSLLFKPTNPFYGRNGKQRICENGQSEVLEQVCIDTEQLWYSNWGYTEPEKIHARLTWNPYFDEIISALHKASHGQ